MTTLAIVSPSMQAISEAFMPCGGCRQVLVEAERRQEAPLRILLQVRDEEVMESESALNLMPLRLRRMDWVKHRRKISEVKVSLRRTVGAVSIFVDVDHGAA